MREQTIITMLNMANGSEFVTSGADSVSRMQDRPQQMVYRLPNKGGIGAADAIRLPG